MERHVLNDADLGALLRKLEHEHFGYDEAGEAAKRAYDALLAWHADKNASMDRKCEASV